MTNDRALIVVDVQNDFLPGGALPVRGGDEIIPPINELMDQFQLVFATMDWHPPEHESFAANHPGKSVGETIDLHGLRQILWPVHCVQETSGADFAPGLNAQRFTRVVQKGTDRAVDSYSGFFDNGHRRSTGLADELKSHSVRAVHIVGLATDYCVKFTALDAAQLGFDVVLIRSACRGVELNSGDVDRAIAEMQQAGVRVI